MTRVVYLHGFSSSPQSRKARYFADRFAEVGVEFVAPQLDEGNFQNLTITGQLRVTGQAVGGKPAILMGSSLGGYIAALYAATHPEIEKLVLLAPAFQFPSRWRARLTPAELDAWKRNGSMLVFHYGAGEERRLGYQYLEDGEQYPDEPQFPQPALILQGTKDEIVPADIARSYAVRHPNAKLVLLDSGHELTDVLDVMWDRVREFLGVPKVIGGESKG